jgi:MOSC domain-containing protein YiiM
MTAPPAGRLVAVNAGQVRDAEFAARAQTRTAIDKRPLDGAVPVGPLGLAGDEHSHPGHGGIYQGLYAYATEDTQFWEAELGRSLWPGAFGENLTTSGVKVSSAVAGERWRVGPVLVEVTGPRLPCQTFASFWGVGDLVKRFTAAGRPGAYLRVLEPGAVRAGDPVVVLSRPDHGVTVADLLAARSGDRSLLPRIRAVAGLPPAWQEWLGHALASAESVKSPS